MSKPAGEREAKRIRVRVEGCESGDARPVVACFQQGAPAAALLDGSGGVDNGVGGNGAGAGAGGGNDTAGRIQFTQYLNMKPGHTHERVVVGDSEHVMYQGRNFGEFDESKALSKYLVGLYNESTGRLTLADAGHVISFRQSVKAQVARAQDSSQADARARHKSLIATFGSVKKQRQMQAREANVVDEDRVTASDAVTDLLQAAVPTTPGGKRTAAGGAGGPGAVATELERRSHILPKYNAAAEKPSDLYPLIGLISPAEGKSLTPLVTNMLKMLKKGSWVSELEKDGSYTQFARSHLQRVADGVVTDKVAKHVVRMTLYFSYLVRLLQASPKLRPSRASEEEAVAVPEESIPALSGIPAEITRRLLSEFTERQEPGGGRVLFVKTGVLVDKLMIHLLIVALVLNDFTLPLTTLCSDLKKRPTELTVLLREVGCTYKREKTSEGMVYVASLKCPPTFPKPKKKRARA